MEGGIFPGSVLSTAGAGVHRAGEELVMPKKQKETEGKQMRLLENEWRDRRQGLCMGGARRDEMHLMFCAFSKYHRQ